MVHGMPRRVSRGIFVVLALVCAHAPVQAQNLAVAQDGIAALLSAPSGTRPVNGSHTGQQRTRFLVGLSKSAHFEVFSLNNPNRVIIEVAETKLRLPAHPDGKPVGLIRSFRAGLSSNQSTRIILSVTEPVIVSSAKIEKTRDGRGQDLVVEVEPFDPVTGSIPAKTGTAAPAAGDAKPLPPPPYALGASGLQPPLPRPATPPDVLAEKAFKPVIVIDPGHGGQDSGAEKNGAVEKDIVLAFSKILAAKLKATGRYRVLMTRDTDVFVPLGERVAFAERNKANLFIAVHCDYADTGSVANGATIYSLRDSLANSMRRAAKGELSGNLLSKDEVAAVKEASGDVDAVRSILADLADREVDVTQDRTSVFARSVIEGMGASTNMRNDPDQQAGFRVLKTAQFPSVLIELAYVTNKQDAANLQSDTWRDKVSDSILTAIENYFSTKLAQLPM
jgi:N-acetylmuramoyl-L-alanine amidase